MYPLTKFKAAPIALALLLTGCAVGPDYEEPQTTMAETFLYSQGDVNQDGVSQNEKHNHWWTQFNDPTLNQLVADVQNQNIPLKLAAERINMANSYKSVVESFKVPTINVGGGYYNYQLSENDSLLGPVFGASDAVESATGMSLLEAQHDGGFLGASIAWEMDLFGRIDKQSNAATIRVEQAEIFQSGLNTLITADVIHNYLQYRGAQERKAIALENIADQKQTLELVTKVVRSGYGSELDLAQAKAMLAATESIVPQLEIAEQVHKQRMAVLLGESLTNVNQRLAGEFTLPRMNDVIPTGLPSDLLEQRPDIRIAEREMAAINEELGASIANRYPKFFLTGTPGVTAGSFDDLFSSDSFGWAASAGISWNVFDGGRGEALVEMNEARFRSAALNYQHSVDSAFAEVDSSLFAYGRSQENQKRIDEATIAVDNAVSKAKSLYKAGLVDYLSVLDAQRQQKAMQDRQVAAKLQTANTTIAVYKALGGDWKVANETQSVELAQVN
ncbi:efflux transporter outer membrane subunit [Vibrio coralliirubri]|uniref:efflux transporter outer membrane subunit n=1 Tax=Vibrio coralliirubri TaxID=1516159 RepID=UPI00063902D3|nr:efflux transporter outer membrane subunit [Vibrio coralliirubri]CDT76524.1 Putative efflux pump outer membrane [Vibrio coralliirubri]